MEVVVENLKKANKLLNTADHLTYMTYPLVKETKLMLTIIEHLYNSLVAGMDAVLSYDRLYKRISPLSSDFFSRLEVFKMKSARRYNIDREYVLLIQDLRRIVEYRKKSPMEFIRGNKLVICDDNYKMKTLTYDKVKEYLATSKKFILKVNNIFKDERRI